MADLIAVLSSVPSNFLLAVFTFFLALFSFLQYRSLKNQEEIIEKDYKPDLELYLTGDDLPILNIHNNGGSSAVGVEVQAENLTEEETYNVEGKPVDVPVIEPMQTVKVKLRGLRGKKAVMVEDMDTLHHYEHKVHEGELDKSDLDILAKVEFRDSRGEKETLTKKFNLMEDRFYGDEVEYPTEDKERYVRGLNEIDTAIRGLGNLLREKL